MREQLAELGRLHVAILPLQDVAVGVGEDQRGVARDVEALGEGRVLLAVQVQGDEMLAENTDHEGVAERGRFEHSAPVAILGAEVDDERQLLVGGLAARHVVIGEPRHGLTVRRRRGQREKKGAEQGRAAGAGRNGHGSILILKDQEGNGRITERGGFLPPRGPRLLREGGRRCQGGVAFNGRGVGSAVAHGGAALLFAPTCR